MESFWSMISLLNVSIFKEFLLETFDKIEDWIDQIEQNIGPEVPIFLVGNKVDLENKRDVPTEVGK
jgi:GTPase SAR1 family protein